MTKEKFKMNDEVWFIYSTVNLRSNICCPCCDGRGTVRSGITKCRTMCPVCSGKANVTSYEKKWQVADSHRTAKISSISKKIFEDETGEEMSILYDTSYFETYRYGFSDESDWVGIGKGLKEDEIFRTLEEAQLECNKRNNENF